MKILVKILRFSIGIFGKTTGSMLWQHEILKNSCENERILEKVPRKTCENWWKSIFWNGERSGWWGNGGCGFSMRKKIENVAWCFEWKWEKRKRICNRNENKVGNEMRKFQGRQSWNFWIWSLFGIENHPWRMNDDFIAFPRRAKRDCCQLIMWYALGKCVFFQGFPSWGKRKKILVIFFVDNWPRNS